MEDESSDIFTFPTQGIEPVPSVDVHIPMVFPSEFISSSPVPTEHANPSPQLLPQHASHESPLSQDPFLHANLAPLSPTPLSFSPPAIPSAIFTHTPPAAFSPPAALLSSDPILPSDLSPAIPSPSTAAAPILDPAAFAAIDPSSFDALPATSVHPVSNHLDHNEKDKHANAIKINASPLLTPVSTTTSIPTLPSSSPSISSPAQTPNPSSSSSSISSISSPSLPSSSSATSTSSMIRTSKRSSTYSTGVDTDSASQISQFEDDSSDGEAELVDCSEFLMDHPSDASLLMQTDAERLQHRDKVAREIIATERSYVNDLILARTLYMLPLKTGIVKRIRPERLKLIFGNMENLIEVNSLLLQRLAEREKHWHPQQLIADVFVELAPMFLLYGDYCQSYGTGCELLKKLELKQDVAQFLQRVAQESAVELRQLGLHDILIMPVQRLPRYLLLLRDLLKDTDAAHPDFDNIKKAIASIAAVADKVNEAIRLAESHQKLLELDRRITVNRHKMPKLVQPGRGLLKEGKLGKITSRFARRGVRFFVTTDLLIYAYRIRGGKEAACKLHFKGTIPLGPSWIRDLQDASDYKHVFQIVAPKKTYTVFADTLAVKQQWVKALNDRIVALVARDPSLKAKRGPVMVSSRTKHFQAADPRFNQSPKSIRRTVATCADLFAPQPEKPAAKTNAPLLYTVVDDAGNGGQKAAPTMGFENDNLDVFNDGKNNHNNNNNNNNNNNTSGSNSLLGRKSSGKQESGKSRSNLPLLALDDEGYQHFGSSDEDITQGLELTEDDNAEDSPQVAAPSSSAAAAITRVTSPVASFLASSPPPQTTSPYLEKSFTPPSDSLSAIFNGDGSPSTRPTSPPPKKPTEQTALRVNTRPSSFMKPIQEDRQPLTATDQQTSFCDCDCNCIVM